MNKLRFAGIILVMAVLGYLYIGSATDKRPDPGQTVKKESLSFYVEGEGTTVELDIWTDTGYEVRADVTTPWRNYALASAVSVDVSGKNVSCKILDRDGKVLDEAGPARHASCDYSTF